MIPLDQFVAVIEDIAPPRYAASWDNTGLLIRGQRDVGRVGLCIDLTELVLDELIRREVDLVLAYHPRIFGGLKRLTGQTAGQRVIMRLLREGLHLYCPHTALDAAPGGMGDWLAQALTMNGLLAIQELSPIQPLDDEPAAGLGRRGRLSDAAPLSALLPGIKSHLGLEQLRVAGSLDIHRRSFALCPGAGGSLFEDLGEVDLLLTGEMRHHDVLARVAGGAAVVLTDHSNCERGFLPVLAARLEQRLPKLEFKLSETDSDPMVIQ